MFNLRSIYRLKFLLILILILCFSTSVLAISNSVGNINGIGAPLANNRIGGESFIRHIGNDKLIFDFKSGGGATVKDRSREGNDGTLGSGAAAPTWKRNSLYFDGGDYVDLTGISYGIGTGEFTLCFNLDEFYGSENYVDIFSQMTERISITLFNNKIYFYHDSVVYITDTGISTISPINFQITRDNSGNLEAYINGKAIGKGGSETADLTYDGSSNLILGAFNDKISRFIIGTMYSFRILNKCLSGIEAQNEYLVNKFAGNN